MSYRKPNRWQMFWYRKRQRTPRGARAFRAWSTGKSLHL
jgi:hypothetical protein